MCQPESGRRTTTEQFYFPFFSENGKDAFFRQFLFFCLKKCQQIFEKYPYGYVYFVQFLYYTHTHSHTHTHGYTPMGNPYPRQLWCGLNFLLCLGCNMHVWDLWSIPSAGTVPTCAIFMNIFFMTHYLSLGAE